MKSVKHYFGYINKINKVFKAFPDPNLNLTKYRHKLWPHYYKDYEQLNYFNNLIKKYGLPEITFSMLLAMHEIPHLYTQYKCKERIKILKEQSNEELFGVLLNILQSDNYLDWDPMTTFLKTKFEHTNNAISLMYYVYSLIIYCPDVDFMHLLKHVEEECEDELEKNK